MTPEKYDAKRLYIFENAMRNLMAVLAAASPAISVNIDIIGRNWDQELDALDSERAWARGAQSVQMPTLQESPHA